MVVINNLGERVLEQYHKALSIIAYITGHVQGKVTEVTPMTQSDCVTEVAYGQLARKFREDDSGQRPDSLVVRDDLGNLIEQLAPITIGDGGERIYKKYKVGDSYP